MGAEFSAIANDAELADFGSRGFSAQQRDKIR